MLDDPEQLRRLPFTDRFRERRRLRSQALAQFRALDAGSAMAGYAGLAEMPAHRKDMSGRFGGARRRECLYRRADECADASCQSHCERTPERDAHRRPCNVRAPGAGANRPEQGQK